jgi:hypothetical protein
LTPITEPANPKRQIPDPYPYTQRKNRNALA